MNYYLDEKKLIIKIDSLFVKTIQEFLDTYIPSKKYQHLLIQNKWITMDGNPCKREDDIVGINLEVNIYPNTHEYKPTYNKVQVVYEDEICLIVFKPKGVLVHSDGNDSETLSDMVKDYYIDKPYIDVQPIHRLDMETSGLVMFSKSEVFQPTLDNLMANNQIRRQYLAFVKGKVQEETFVCAKPIGKDRHNAKKRVVSKNGQSALTKFKLVGTRNGISVLRCILDTGRTHQIRVHLSSLGYPIINDDLYGVRDESLVRMGLIGDILDFYHPLKEEMMEIEADLPNDMNKLLNEVL